MPTIATTGPLPRTPDEIVAHMRGIADTDYFGHQRGDLMDWLPFSHAKEWLKPEATKTDWTKTQRPYPLTRERVLQEMLGYMPFAWGKANDCRGLSAGRSVEHMTAWLWLLGDPLGERLEGMYAYYGKTCLRAICEAYGWPWRQWDDDRWGNAEEGPYLSADQVPAP
ncbi:MAG: hypothetical protein ACEQSH_00450 [Bacteroidia bacterium]|jgi:hypothetical protein